MGARLVDGFDNVELGRVGSDVQPAKNNAVPTAASNWVRRLLIREWKGRVDPNDFVLMRKTKVASGWKGSRQKRLSI